MLEYIFYVITGAFAGMLAGLLGVGGGLVIVPALAAVFAVAGVGGSHVMHLAIGTSLATIVFTSLSSVTAHHRRGAVQWDTFLRLTPGIVVGALAGSVIAGALSGAPLRRIFGVFELLVASQMAFGLRPSPRRRLPGMAALSAAGGVIGLVSAVVGIGGGTLTVPFLVWSNVDMRQAVATSAACGLPIAAAGAVGFALTGWDETALVPWAVGYVYLPALLSIAVASVVFAPLGARLAHALPAQTLRRVFALLLLAVGGRMLLG